MTSLLAVAAMILLSAQSDASALLQRLEGLDEAAAARLVATERDATRRALDDLLARVDASVHSQRDRPEQRRVQYDEQTLALGIRVSALYARATGDASYSRRFDARKQRLAGTVLLNDRKYAEALKPLTAALEEAVALDDDWLHVITRVNLAYAHLELGHGEAALRESERARDAARSLDDRARTLTLYNLGSVHLHLRNYGQSVEFSRQAAALSRSAGIRLWQGNALLNMGAAHQQLGDLTASQAAFEDALGVLTKTSDRLGTGRALYNLAVVAARQERYRDAATLMERALPIIRGTDIRHSHEIEITPERYHNPFEVAALEVLVECYTQLGESDPAAAHMTALREARARAPQGGHSHKIPH